MKSFYKVLLGVGFMLVLFFAGTAKTRAQLAAGDILFTGYNGNPAAGSAPDTFTFVALVAIPSSTTIYFTERGYQGSSTWQASGGTEGTLTVTTNTALAIGDEVEIFGTTVRRNAISIGTASVSGGNVTTGLSLSNAGDQIIAFQGGSGNPAGVGATMIAGINWSLSCGTTTDANWNGSGCTYGAQTSLIPPGLTGGTNAFLAGTAGTSPNNDHARFNATTAGAPFGTAAALKTAILNKANWDFGGATGSTIYDLAPGYTYFGTLPLKLLSFTGKATKQGNLLNWTTTAEVNVDGFLIEKSVDGLNFSAIGKVSAGKQQYTFTDNNNAGKSFYRLKMVDQDASYTYSPVVMIDNNTVVDYSISPNPVTGNTLVLQSRGNTQKDIAVKVIDVTGREWYTGTITAATLNSGKASIPAGALVAGMYILQIRHKETGTIKMIKFRKE